MCPGTTVTGDPRRRVRRFMAWAGSKGYTDVGSAAVDIGICGHIEWLSCWLRVGGPPWCRPEDERRPQRVLKLHATDRPTGVEPSATLRGPKGAGKQEKGPPATTTTQRVVQPWAGPTGQGKPPAVSLWPTQPGPGQPPVGNALVKQWNDFAEEDRAPAMTTKRQRRNIRAALLNRSCWQWVCTRERRSIHNQKHVPRVHVGNTFIQILYSCREKPLSLPPRSAVTPLFCFDRM